MVFCVEDDNSIRNMVLYTLNSAGIAAKGFEEGKTFWEALKEEKPDLILLDIMLPGDEDGLKILTKLKASSVTSSIPVIIATAKGGEYDKVLGLDSGADDYLVKPFGMMEMVSRIKAVLRRSKGESCSVLKYEGIEIKIDEHLVLVDGKVVDLTLKEFEILCFFIKNAGVVISRDKILSAIWSMDYFGETRTVDVHIGTLRNKLGESGKYLQTVRGVGYKMEKSQ